MDHEINLFWIESIIKLDHEHTEKKDCNIKDLSGRAVWARILWTASWHTNCYAMP